MARVTFGAILQDARERKGYDLSTAARRLRIRPDILRAIEENDFARMPPRGYTRNMVNAYARLLGLNPTEIMRMYLDEAYAYQVGRARSDASPAASRFDMGDGGRSRRSQRPSRQDDFNEETAHQNAFGRKQYDDRTAFSRSDYGHSRGSAQERERSHSSGRTHASRHSAVPTTQYTNFYAGPKAPNTLQSKLPFIIVGVVILLLLILVITLFFGGNKGGKAEDVPSVPVTGLTDTTQGEDSSQHEQQVAPKPVAPTSVTVVYELPSGQSAYAIITTDGVAEEKMLTGPVKETVEVKGVWSLATWVSDSLTVTVNGQKVTYDSTNSSGMPTCTVDFNTYLEKWKADNPTASTGTSDTASGATGSDAASSTGTGSASGTGTTTTNGGSAA